MGAASSVIDAIPALPKENKTTVQCKEASAVSRESRSESESEDTADDSSDAPDSHQSSDDEDDDEELMIRNTGPISGVWKIEPLVKRISPDSRDGGEHLNASGVSDVEDTDESPDSGDLYDSSEDEDEDKIVTVKEKVDDSWKEKELKDLGITFVFTNKDDAKAMGECKIVKWSTDKRNDQMEEILSEKEIFASDIFEVVTASELALEDGVTITVTLAKNISKRHKVIVKLKVDGYWVKEDVSFKSSLWQSGKAEFKTKRLQHFVIVGALETKKIKVPAEGATIKVDESSKLEMEIPAGAVDSDQDINFQKYMEGEKPICKSIIGVTECLYGDNQTIDLKKPIHVKLPFEERQDKVEDTTVVPFEMVGKEIKMMDPQTNVDMSEEGVCNIEVSQFRGYFAAAVKNECLTNTKLLESDARLLFGTNYVANILMFREKVKMPTGFPRIWIQIVDKVDVEKVVEMRRIENDLIEVHNSRSPDVNVFDGFRLRIDIEGNLQGLCDIPRNHYLITYLDVSNDNHEVFTVEKRGTLDAYGSIIFYSDKGSKHRIHLIDIDTSVGFKKIYRSDHYGERRQTMNEITIPEKYSEVSSERRPSTASTTDALCPALNGSSLFNIAGMMVEEDDGLKLSIELGMSDNFESISQNSESPRVAVFKLLKEWVKKQTDTEEAVDALNKGLICAKFKKVADVFMKAVRNDDEV